MACTKTKAVLAGVMESMINEEIERCDSAPQNSYLERAALAGEHSTDLTSGVTEKHRFN